MNTSLPQSEFYILLSLAIKQRHGYEIMQQIEQDSGGKVLLGPGTLYGSIKRMLQSNLIEEVSGNDPRRKYYKLTENGRTALAHELQRYNDAVELARRTGIFPRLGVEESVSQTTAR
jgi:DNA-binding PadR family transcriptional regulator